MMVEVTMTEIFSLFKQNTIIVVLWLLCSHVLVTLFLIDIYFCDKFNVTYVRSAFCNLRVCQSAMQENGMLSISKSVK
jgi:hypothetical protein